MKFSGSAKLALFASFALFALFALFWAKKKFLRLLRFFLFIAIGNVSTVGTHDLFSDWVLTWQVSKLTWLVLGEDQVARSHRLEQLCTLRPFSWREFMRRPSSMVLGIHDNVNSVLVIQLGRGQVHQNEWAFASPSSAKKKNIYFGHWILMCFQGKSAQRRWWVGLVLGRGFNPRGMETCRGSIPPSPRDLGTPGKDDNDAASSHGAQPSTELLKHQRPALAEARAQMWIGCHGHCRG